MAKTCTTFDHPADVGLLARGDSVSEVFEALAEGLAGFICTKEQVQVRESRQLSAEAEDIEALVVDFLSAVLRLIQTDHFMVAAAEATLEETDRKHAIQARLVGEPYDPTRHEIHTEVKAITYHMLQVKQDGQQWTGRVILDL